MAAPAPNTGSEQWLVGIDLGGTAAKLGLLRCDALAAASSTDNSSDSGGIDGLVVHLVRAPLPVNQADRCVFVVD